MRISIDVEVCKGCGLCADRCVFQAVSLREKAAVVDPAKCYGCGVCAVTCPTGAIRLHRKERSPIYDNGLELMHKIYKENRP